MTHSPEHLKAAAYLRHIKREGSHSPDCRAMESVKHGSWHSPWYLPGAFETRDALGRKGNNGYTRWIIAKCNATNCKAIMLIREDDIVQGLPHE